MTAELQTIIATTLAVHRWTKYSRCECGWTVRACIFPDPQISGLVQFETHVAENIAAELSRADAKADAL